MKKSLKKIKLWSLFIFGFQLLAIVFFGICYFNNYFGLYDLISESIMFIIFSSLILIDVFFVWVITLIFGSIRKRTDLKVAELIGQDVTEAYNFGMIGLVVIDQNGTILWVNDLFKERQIDILDTNIFEWQPTLKTLSEGEANATQKLVINSRNYEVKLLKDAGLFIFKDNTDLETITDYSNRQAVVVGQLIIDNYSEISTNESESEDLMNDIRSAIAEYCKEFGVLVRKIRNDSYFLLCNHENLQKIEKDKFSILDKIRKIGEKEIIPPTISIGIAYDFPDVMKLNEMANNDIEIAMSRGGDQVVISKYGDELVFVGGKSVAIENKNKVKVRVMADSILSLIKSSSNVVIMGHDMMDMDALGACLGMTSMCEYCGKDALIVYDPKKTERKARGAVSASFNKEELDIFVTEAKALSEIKNNTLVIVVDVHRAAMTMSPKVVEKATKIMIIDHHRRGEDMIESPIFAVVDPSVSSSCELIAELIYFSSANPRISVPEPYATIMLSGIFLDSNYFKNTTGGSKTFEASMILKEFGADNAKADDFLKDEFEEYALINKIVATLKTPSYGIVYCVADNDDVIESATLAKVANQCMQMKGVNACFVIGRISTDEIKISCRSDGSINVQILAEKLNGGGHFSQAAGSFKKITVKDAEDKLLNVLNEYLNDARTAEGKK